MNSTQVSGSTPHQLKLTYPERLVLAEWLRVQCLSEFEQLSQLPIAELALKSAQLQRITRALWHVEGADIDSEHAPADAIIGESDLIEYLRIQTRAAVHALAEEGYTGHDVDDVDAWTSIEHKLGLDRRAMRGTSQASYAEAMAA